MYPFLSLADVHLDTVLAQRLPRRLAYYHLALPIAQDAEGITVAMAHPDNPKVVSVIQSALGAPVIPVRSFAETIRQQLDSIWQAEPPADPADSFSGLRVTHWAHSIDVLSASTSYVENLLAALGRESQVEQSTAPDFALSPNTDLVIAAVGDAPLPDHLFRTQASLLVLQNPPALPQAILHVLRGHIPDYRVLDWLVPLASLRDSNVTLFMGIDGIEGNGSERKSLVSDLSSILLAQDKRKAHIAECRRVLSDAGIAGRLKIRQETLLTAIRDELSERPYDLVAMAAEAYGDFAQQVWEVVRSSVPAFLVIKP